MSIDLVTDTALSVAEPCGDTLVQVDAADLDPDPLAQLDGVAGGCARGGHRQRRSDGARDRVAGRHPGRPDGAAQGLRPGAGSRSSRTSRAARPRSWRPTRAPPAPCTGSRSTGRCGSKARRRPLPEERAQAYFDTRPRDSRLAAWASPQSQVIADRAELERLYAEAEQRFTGVGDPPLPPHWGGYLLVAGRASSSGRAGRTDCTTASATSATATAGAASGLHRRARTPVATVRVPARLSCTCPRRSRADSPSLPGAARPRSGGAPAPGRSSSPGSMGRAGRRCRAAPS